MNLASIFAAHPVCPRRLFAPLKVKAAPADFAFATRRPSGSGGVFRVNDSRTESAVK